MIYANIEKYGYYGSDYIIKKYVDDAQHIKAENVYYSR
jgi:hypothetical protein